MNFFTQHTIIQPYSVNLSKLAFPNFFLCASTGVVFASTDAVVFPSSAVTLVNGESRLGLSVHLKALVYVNARHAYYMPNDNGKLSLKGCQSVILHPAKVSVKCEVKKKK